MTEGEQGGRWTLGPNRVEGRLFARGGPGLPGFAMTEKMAGMARPTAEDCWVDYRSGAASWEAGVYRVIATGIIIIPIRCRIAL